MKKKFTSEELYDRQLKASREWKERNKAAVREYGKLWNEANKVLRKELKQKWDSENIEHRKAYQKSLERRIQIIIKKDIWPTLMGFPLMIMKR